ncbi:hypothetical protein [Cupriavidus consociatus]|uniref:hypothetical protein n=1 Tax=Cupriavidus consociatus TaxID=2821357 RepID=UPI001AE463EB|nr:MULTISPECIES: hypothetical protein [unclassified Cupriavidus]MBP0621563.1 hypothetical protein [Cupriavidus sp. LEh25]MDK2658236.1 hypothetical protein [Cupriavidus sp. LEh21]
MYDDLLGDLSDCLDRIVGGDINREREVADLIERCMRAIEAEVGMVGPREQQELARARVACDDGYLRLALSSARKALAASERQKEVHGLGDGIWDFPAQTMRLRSVCVGGWLPQALFHDCRMHRRRTTKHLPV